MRLSFSALFISMILFPGSWANSESSTKKTVIPPVWVLLEGIPSTGVGKVHVMSPILTKNKRLALDRNSKNQQHLDMVKLLDAGTEFSRPTFGNDLAKIIAQMPAECQDKIVIESFSAPVKELGHHVAGTPDDARRIREITIKGCFKKTPAACTAIPGNPTDGIADFGFGSILTFFSDCKDEMNHIADTQRRLDIWAERTAVELPVPKHRE